MTDKNYDEIAHDEARSRARSLLKKNGWAPTSRISTHSIIELMAALAMDVSRHPLSHCGYPDCGCDEDAVCANAVTKELQS